MTALTMDKLIALCKGRGFIFPGSEIYGGLANTWDYGPLGVELKNNIKREWWKRFVLESEYNFGLDSAILMNPKVWEASGHIGGFSDPMTDCRICHARHRADDLIENFNRKKGLSADVNSMTPESADRYIKENKIPCPVCGGSDFTPVRQFNLMFKTFQGVTEDSLSTVYLRPETAQGIFVNFKNVLRTTRARIPFGIAQAGKSFRNEITPGNFIFRVREFDQMELEFFCRPGTDLEWFGYWKDFCRKWLLDMGIREESIRLRDHDKAELSFYSRATTDFEFLYPFGWGELWGIADRTDYDLSRHRDCSGENMDYTDPATGEKYLPYVIEPSLGVERMFLAVLCDAYDEEEVRGEKRVVLRLSPALAPVKVAVLPLQKNLSEKARGVYRLLKARYAASWDETGSIGKRYRRQDEAGTPFCVTVDFDTLEDDSVTVRERDSMAQIRLPVDGLTDYLDKEIPR